MGGWRSWRGVGKGIWEVDVHDIAVFAAYVAEEGYLDEEDCQDLAKALARIDCEMSSDAE